MILNTDNINAYDSSGNAVVASMLGAKGCSLAPGTYYFPIGDDGIVPGDAPIASVHLMWSAALAATFTLETSNFPKLAKSSLSGAADVNDWSSNAGEWVQENPLSAQVSVTGAGNSSAAATVTAGGTAIGAATYHISGLGTRRARIKVVVTVAGLARVGTHTKSPLRP